MLKAVAPVVVVSILFGLSAPLASSSPNLFAGRGGKAARISPGPSLHSGAAGYALPLRHGARHVRDLRGDTVRMARFVAPARSAFMAHARFSGRDFAASLRPIILRI
jgi:hypothetical protein